MITRRVWWIECSASLFRDDGWYRDEAYLNRAPPCDVEEETKTRESDPAAIILDVCGGCKSLHMRDSIREGKRRSLFFWRRTLLDGRWLLLEQPNSNQSYNYIGQLNHNVLSFSFRAERDRWDRLINIMGSDSSSSNIWDYGFQLTSQSGCVPAPTKFRRISIGSEHARIVYFVYMPLYYV
jgi:hypothetical protein